jgi:hypothetical protein
MPQAILLAGVIALLVLWSWVKGVAASFGAAPTETAYLLGWGIVGLVAALAALLYDVAKVGTTFSTYLLTLIPFVQPFLSSIANHGLSPDDPMIWNFQNPWYASKLLWWVIALGMSALIAWFWRKEHSWY